MNLKDTTVVHKLAISIEAGFESSANTTITFVEDKIAVDRVENLKVTTENLVRRPLQVTLLLYSVC